MVRKQRILLDVRMLAWPALAAGSAMVAYCCWQLPGKDVRLRVSDASQDQVRITWNPDSAPVLLARAGAVEILDGGTYRQAVLTAEQLHAGSVTYRRESGTLEVRLRLESRWHDSARVWFRGPEPQPLRPLTLPAPILAEVRTRAANISERTAAPPQPSTQGIADRALPAPRRAAVIPDSRPAPIETASVAIPLPPVEQIAKPAALGALSLPVPAPRPPSYSGPRSGRIIWTGSMSRRGVVEIEGSRASIGAISGGLPGVPVSMRIAPAEFSAGGLVVHSSDASSHNRREAPSAANGWNATLFQWAPNRAGELVVLESPNPSNDYKRLVVRNDAHTCSVIVVDWTVR